MAIREKFGQAVIGSVIEDVTPALIQIHRPDINLVSAYRPQHPAMEHYLRGLDIEGRYMQPTSENLHPEYGREPAFLSYSAGDDSLTIRGDIPEGAGRTQFLDHMKEGAQIFSQLTGFEDVQVMWRVLGETKKGLVFHVDNDVTLRGLETIMGKNRTLWLPDQSVDLNNFECHYDERGKANGNWLRTAFKDHTKLEQVDHYHMSIHKGSAFSNPLFHTAAGQCPELNMKPGTRSILTYDQAVTQP